LLSFTFSLLSTSSAYSLSSHSVVQTDKRPRSVADGPRGPLEPKVAMISSIVTYAAFKRALTVLSCHRLLRRQPIMVLSLCRAKRITNSARNLN